MPRVSIAESVNRVLTEISSRMGGYKLRVGFLEGATYPDGTPVAAAMFWAEYGHGGRFPSPPRSFFRTMIAKESPEWSAKMAALAKATNYDGKTVLKWMGEDIAGALRQSMIETNSPELSPTTLILRAKFWMNPQSITFGDVLAASQLAHSPAGATVPQASGTQAKPLVWTGHALASISYEVKQ